MQHNPKSRTSRLRVGLISLFAVLALSIALPLASYTVHWFGTSAVAQDASSATNPRANYWRAVREGISGYSAVKGEGANVLVQASGQDWRNTRNSQNYQRLPWLIGGVFVLLLLYHLIAGRNKLVERPLSGRKIKRWSWFSRLVHWVTAISFIALAITGLSMFFGKTLLIPLLGKAGFALWAGYALNIHNVLGLVFSVGVIMMIVLWIWHNFPTAVDFKWLASGGGMFKRNHPSAGRLNAGEKLWFWLVATLGVLVCLSGLVQVYQVFSPLIPAAWAIPAIEITRSMMQQASLLHPVFSIVMTAVALGHIYIGTAGTEGALEGMTTGKVSAEWAKQHHDIWYAQMADKGKIIEPVSSSGNHRSSTSKPATAG